MHGMFNSTSLVEKMSSRFSAFMMIVSFSVLDRCRNIFMPPKLWHFAWFSCHYKFSLELPVHVHGFFWTMDILSLFSVLAIESTLNAMDSEIKKSLMVQNPVSIHAVFLLNVGWLQASLFESNMISGRCLAQCAVLTSTSPVEPYFARGQDNA